MNINEYLSRDKKIRSTLIVSNVKRLNALIRAFEKNNDKDVKNVAAITIEDMAKTIINLEEAKNGFDERYINLEANEATALFKTILLQERDEASRLFYFDGKEEILKAEATYREIFDKVNLIRENNFADRDKSIEDGVLSDEAKARILDLDTLVTEYEAALINGNGSGKEYLDSTASVFKAFEIIKAWDDAAAEKNIALLFGKDIAILAEDKEQFSGIKLAFLILLEEKSKREIPDVRAFEKDQLEIKDLINLEGRTEFFKGYGSFSEASYVVNDIAEKKHPFGEVHIVCMSPSQIPTIISEFKGNDIPTSIISDYSMKDNSLINLVLRIIDWAESDYSEGALEKILSSDSLFVQDEDETAKYPNIVFGERYHNYIDGWTSPAGILGWGFTRNRAYADLAIEMKDDEAAKDKKGDAPYYRQMGIMHHSLLDIFAEKGKSRDEINRALQTSEIYDRLLAFVEKYSLNNKERNAGISKLRSLQRELSFDKGEVTLGEALSVIRGHIEEINMKDSPSNDAVTVELCNDWTVLERPYVYFAGMALKDMEVPSNESPILTDGEIEHYIYDGKKFTRDSINKRRIQGMYRTLSTFSGEKIGFGYSNFEEDSSYVKLPSTLYRKLLETYSELSLENVVEFVKGNPDESGIKAAPADLSPDKDEDSAVEEGTEKKLYERAPGRITSSTKADTFISCPKAFAYSNITYIPELSFRDKNVNSWLEKNEKGIIFHEIMADYVNELIVEKSLVSVDDAILRDFAEEKKSEMKKYVPYPFEELTDIETEEIILIAKKTLEKLCDEMHNSDWKPIAAELHFTDAIYNVKTFDDEEVSFTYNGYIDRLDYRLDSQNQMIALRIIDYKTGKMDNQKKKVEKNWSTLQHLLYKHAVISADTKVEIFDENYDKMTKVLADYLKELIGKKVALDLSTWGISFDEFIYSFPFANAEESDLAVLDELYEPAEKRLRLVLTALYDKKIYPDILELEEYVDELVGKGIDVIEFKEKFYKEKNLSNPCGFCVYKSLCVNRKSGDIK